jgi:DNA polymerase IV
MSERVIFHIDVNSAFLSWSAAYRVRVLGESRDLRDIPSAICGDTEQRHGIILAKSAPAKAYGIKTGEPLFQARQKCPGLIVERPDYSLYVDASRRFIELLREIAPQVEQYSIDEAWADLSHTSKLYGDHLSAAAKIKNRVRDELGFSVTIGISSNKLLAKVAGDLGAPDQVQTLFPEEIAAKLWPLPVRNLFYVGEATERQLRQLGINTIGELAAADPRRLRQHLHKPGELLWAFANDCCDDAVSEETVLNKSYGNSTTTARDICERSLAHRILLSLSETVAMRLRADRQSGRCVSVSLRTREFHNLRRQARLAQPTDATSEIYRASCRLFDELWDSKTPLRQLGVSISMLSRESSRQYCLFCLDNYDKLAAADAAVDRIREKFGEEAIIRATFLQPEVAPLTGGLCKERRTGVTKPV